MARKPPPAPSREGRSRAKKDTKDTKEKKKRGRPRKELVLPDRPLESLGEELERLLGFFKPHQVTVLRARLGIDGPQTTLDEAGRLVGMTRERVRQLETRFFAYFLGMPAATGLIERVGRLRDVTGSPLFLRDLASKDCWFAGFAAESEVLRPLLDAASGSELHCVTTPMGVVIASRPITSWEELLDVAVKMVKQLGSGTNRQVVRKTVANLVKEREAPELLDVLLTAVESNIQYSSGGMLVAFGRFGPAVVEAILEDSDRPLHFSEVARRWSERAGKPVAGDSARGALEDSTNVVLLGRGTYGLAKHIGLTPAAVTRLIADCEAIVTTVAPKKQWHTRELFEALKTSGRAAGKADMYIINACLSRSSVLESVGRFVWAVRRRRPRTTADRIDLRNAAVQALERAGRPLRQDELRREMERTRGMGENLLILPTERMAQTAPRTWGLLDRDFVLTGRQRMAVGDATYNAAVKRGAALHSSELLEVLAAIAIPEGVTPYMIRQVAGRDSRLKLFKGDFIGLREWEDARRPTWREAMAQIAGSLEAPVTLDWLHAELERKVGRSLSRVHLYSIVSESGLTINPGQTRGPHRRTKSDGATNKAPS